MRTTLDIDDDVLQAAKELARAEKKTAGQVLSELARKGLTGGARASALAEEAAEYTGAFVKKNGWYVLPSRGGVITNEMIDKIQEELDLEDARAAGRELPAKSDG
jgi:hypothetical protein